MKAILFFLMAIFFAQNAIASDRYIIDPSHANITWFCNHFGFSDVSGTFGSVEGQIFFDETNPAQSFVKTVIKTDSLVTAVPKLTEHLKSKDFFNTEKFPEAKFESMSVKKAGKKTGFITGNLTLLGVTKPVKLKTVFNKKAVNQFTQKRTVGFSGEATIKRSDFGMKYGLPGVADEVKIFIEVEAIHEEDILLGTN